ncbi:hypothetical protein EG68_10546 [Paragonimus skrjabini miyazakii]|uniref:O-phosphoseryl-tRNA(Sec) selenium transferase n=1 Tax=Paragonimus skrjabini miyazakii TaxID=59628 RepID=A0A8S9YBU9_9TREM|nr:hypothetical protein EG68_10546 [Paragonimus skrjabini miyazakii]
MLDDDTLQLTESYISVAYVNRSRERLSRVRTKFMNILKTGNLPEYGFSESDIEALFLQLGTLDSNNWDHSVGVGEREGRVLLDLVRRRHFGLTHGIGRSGDIAAIQPKAPGSSLINRLTNQLVLDWLRKSGAPSTAACFVVPMATGMTLTLCLLTLKQRRPTGARFVIWPRIDQKSCFKCILAAGLIPVPVNPREGSDDPKRAVECQHQLGCDLKRFRQALTRPAAYLLKHWPEAAQRQGITSTDADKHGPESVVCALTTTLCFSPRVPDRLFAITRACMDYGVAHLVNNAYGVQSSRCMRMIESAGQLVMKKQPDLVINGTDLGRQCSVDDEDVVLAETGETSIAVQPSTIDLLYVQSTDKNLMVPVGGAIVAGFTTNLVNAVAKSYPGRASATPSVDVLATLLHLGVHGWRELLKTRETCFQRLHSGLRQLADRHGLNVLATPDNPISLAVDLNPLISVSSPNTTTSGRIAWHRLTRLGAQLFTQGCSGVRVVLPATAGTVEQLGDYTFPGFGSHSSTSTTAYLNAAAAIGQTEADVNAFLIRLDKVLHQFRRADPNNDTLEQRPL